MVAPTPNWAKFRQMEEDSVSMVMIGFTRTS